MTEKRFRKVQGFIADNQDMNDNPLDLTEIEDMLNKLNDENELLRCIIVETLDFIEENNGISLEEMKKWFENKEKELQ